MRRSTFSIQLRGIFSPCYCGYIFPPFSSPEPQYTSVCGLDGTPQPPTLRSFCFTLCSLFLGLHSLSLLTSWEFLIASSTICTRDPSQDVFHVSWLVNSRMSVRFFFTISISLLVCRLMRRPFPLVLERGHEGCPAVLVKRDTRLSQKFVFSSFIEG